MRPSPPFSTLLYSRPAARVNRGVEARIRQRVPRLPGDGFFHSAREKSGGGAHAPVDKKAGEALLIEGMKRAARPVLTVLTAGVLFLGMGAAGAGPVRGPSGQETPPQEVQKPKFDYMSNWLSRSTQPLGLKRDPAARALLGQGSVKWAIRSSPRHILE